MLANEDEIREQVALLLVTGFETDRDIVRSMIESFDLQTDKEARHAVRTIVSEGSKAMAVAQKRWPRRTDCDRLDEAFEALEHKGIVARHNFTCCMTCGLEEIGSEMKRRSIGYVFYHMQDTERAAAGQGLCLAYGCRRGDEAGGLRIGENIVATLEKVGLKTKWNGRFSDRILVKLDWKRRRLRRS
ncbi:MAG: hypothetical protein HYY16_11885 [Planctomycetes bacterium]|nr:hypothetical protein [Planctomycetota bacterium]